MAITVEGRRTEFATVLQVVGRLDGGTAGEFEQICRRWIAPGDRNMVLDFSGVEYISSAGLSTVLAAGKAMDAQRGRLLLCGLAPRMRQVFLFSGFDALFPLFDTFEEAIADCKRNRSEPDFL
jgi:anti-anti-sigma factor